MPLLKLYSNSSNNSNNSNNNNNLKLNERVITPNSIPIFILPPTLESCRKNSNNSTISAASTTTTPTATKYLSYSTQNVNNKIYNQTTSHTIHTSTSLHDLKIDAINCVNGGGGGGSNSNKKKNLSTTLIDNVNTNVEKKSNLNDSRNDRKSHSLPFVTINNTTATTTTTAASNSLLNKMRNKKKSRSLFHSGLFNLLNLNSTAAATVANEEKESSNNHLSWILNDQQQQQQGSKSANRLSVNYLTIDEIHQSSSSNNHRIKTNNRSAKSLTNNSSRNSLINIDSNFNTTNKLIAYLTPTLGAKNTTTTTTYQKTRSKSETMITLPQLLSSHLNATKNNNNASSSTNVNARKRLSYQNQNSLIKRLGNSTSTNIRYKRQSDILLTAYGGLRTPTTTSNSAQQTPQQQKQFSFRNIFKLNNSSTETQQQSSQGGAGGKVRASLDTMTVNSPTFTNTIFSRFSISSAKTSLLNYTFGVKGEPHQNVTSFDDSTSQDNSLNNDIVKANDEQTDEQNEIILIEHEENNPTEEDEEEEEAMPMINKQAIPVTKQHKMNFFQLLLNNTKKLSSKTQQRKSLSSNILDDNTRLINNNDSSKFPQTKYLQQNENKKEILNGYIDFSIKYETNSKEIIVQLVNLNIKPLIEINKIKAKLTYICSIDKENLLMLTNNTTTTTSNGDTDEFHNLLGSSNKTRKNNNNKNCCKKIKKVKIDPNMRSKISKIKYKLFKKAQKQINNSEYVILNSFILDIEIQSFLPLSRKLLSSTFRYNSKRIFKGKLLIENIELTNLSMNNLDFIQKEFEFHEI